MPNIDDIPYGYCQCGCGQNTNIAKKTSTKEGRIKGQPSRYVVGHGGHMASMTDRFWRYVSPGPFHECWLWQGHTNRGGYGRIGRDRSKDMMLAHRFSWELHFGPVPADLCVLHRCDVRRCVNPYHLFLGTYADNTADMRAKGRQGDSGAKLTEAQVIEIRALAAQGMRHAHIARRFGMNQTTIFNIVRRQTWRHLP